MTTAFILRLLACVLVTFYGAPVKAFKLTYEATGNTKDLCRDISDKINFRPKDQILGSLAVELGKINLCKEQYKLWFWQSEDSNEKERLNQISEAASSRIHTLKKSNWEFEILFGVHFLVGICIEMRRLLSSEDVQKLIVSAKEKAIAGFEFLIECSYQFADQAREDNKKEDAGGESGEIILLEYHPARKQEEGKKKKKEILMIEYRPIDGKRNEAENKVEILLIEYKVEEASSDENDSSFLKRISKLEMR
jgi:hypothetical protein